MAGQSSSRSNGSGMCFDGRVGDLPLGRRGKIKHTKHHEKRTNRSTSHKVAPNKPQRGASTNDDEQSFGPAAQSDSNPGDYKPM